MSLLFQGLSGVAFGFCGTYVGSPGTELVNHTSQVVIARQGDRTSLTLVADVEGDTSDFALLIPVPSALDASDVRTIDPSVVDRLDRYSTPRLVEYTCHDAITVDHVAPLGGCGMVTGCAAEMSYEGAPPAGTVEIDYSGVDGGVTVESAFRTAEYDVVVLSATGAGGLYDWLDDNGFAVPEGGEDILQDYIDGGAYFLAAKVHMEEGGEGPARLSPLQIRYHASVWSLPIRIGTISASGEQEVLIYTLTDDREGDVKIANYPQLEVEDECMWRSDDGDFGKYYEGALDAARGDDGPGWVTEYSWLLYKLSMPNSVHCDPCTVQHEELYDAGELADLGWSDTYGQEVDTGWATTWDTGAYDDGGPLLTRIRMVYRPDEVPEDLVLYQTGSHDENQQIRFIDYDRRLEFLFPVCGEGFVDAPGMCGDELDESGKGGGRSSVPFAPPLALGALGALALASRRRRS